MRRFRPHQIRAARVELGLTQPEFVAALGLRGQRTVSDWEAGRRNAPGPVHLAIAHLLALHRGELPTD